MATIKGGNCGLVAGGEGEEGGSRLSCLVLCDRKVIILPVCWTDGLLLQSSITLDPHDLHAALRLN